MSIALTPFQLQVMQAIEQHVAVHLKKNFYADEIVYAGFKTFGDGWGGPMRKLRGIDQYPIMYCCFGRLRIKGLLEREDSPSALYFPNCNSGIWSLSSLGYEFLGLPSPT